jgi:hypothetical protein
MSFVLAYNLPKGLHERVQCLKLLTGLAQFLQIGPFVGLEIVKRPSDQP